MNQTTPLPHTLLVKGRYWYFRAPGSRKVMRLQGNPGDPEFMSIYRRLLKATGVTLKRQRQQQRLRAAEGRAKQANRSLVYFVRMGADGPIKIGHAIDVSTRIARLQTAMPHALTLLATCEGGRAKESEYHARFAHARIRGEWFEAVPDLLAEISELEQMASGS